MHRDSLSVKAERKYVWIALLCGSAILGGIYLMRGRVDRAAQPTARGTVSEAPAADQKSSTLLFELKEGISYTYAFSQRSAVTGAGGATLVGFRLQGELELTSIDDARIAAVLRAAVSELDVTGSDANLERFRREVAEPFVIELGPDPPRVHASANASTFVTRIWASLAHQLRARSPESAATAWQHNQRAPLGSCDLGYEKKASDVYSRIIECKPSAAQIAYARIESSQTYKISNDGSLANLESRERVETEATGPMPAIASTSDLTMRLVAVGPATDIARMAQHAATLALVQDRSDADGVLDQREQDRARAQAYSVPAALAEMVKAGGTKPGSPLTGESEKLAGRAYVALTAHLRLEPTAYLDGVRRHITEGGPIAATLIAALRDAGTAEAQAVLAELVKEEDMPADYRLAATRALSRVEEPTQQTVEELRAMVANPAVGQQALYGLGSNVHRLKRSDPELANAVVQELVTTLASSTTTEAKR